MQKRIIVIPPHSENWLYKIQDKCTAIEGWVYTKLESFISHRTKAVLYKSFTARLAELCQQRGIKLRSNKECDMSHPIHIGRHVDHFTLSKSFLDLLRRKIVCDSLLEDLAAKLEETSELYLGKVDALSLDRIDFSYIPDKFSWFVGVRIVVYFESPE